jgi:hypothetical protein
MKTIPVDQACSAQRFMLSIQDIREKCSEHKNLPL